MLMMPPVLAAPLPTVLDRYESAVVDGPSCPSRLPPAHTILRCAVLRQAARGVKLDVELSAGDLKELVERYKGVYTKNGQELPSDPYKQLEMAICAVFRSWNAPRAGGWGTATRARVQRAAAGMHWRTHYSKLGSVAE